MPFWWHRRILISWVCVNSNFTGCDKICSLLIFDLTKYDNSKKWATIFIQKSLNWNWNFIFIFRFYFCLFIYLTLGIQTGSINTKGLLGFSRPFVPKRFLVISISRFLDSTAFISFPARYVLEFGPDRLIDRSNDKL